MEDVQAEVGLCTSTSHDSSQILLIYSLRLRLCPEWDKVDPSFRDKDGGNRRLALAADNPTLDAFRSPPPQAFQRRLYPDKRGLRQSPTWASPSPIDSELHDREEEMTRSPASDQRSASSPHPCIIVSSQSS